VCARARSNSIDEISEGIAFPEASEIQRSRLVGERSKDETFEHLEILPSWKKVQAQEEERQQPSDRLQGEI
jgi:hypothetical protein